MGATELGIAQPLEADSPSGPATRVRYLILGLATANALLLYLDRMCMTTIVHSPVFEAEMKLGEENVGAVLSYFFLAYALGQLPAGWLADRFGARRTLGCYVLLWSLFTASSGLAVGLTFLLVMRVGCGLSEAGAYPASGRLVRNWFPLSQRARASGIVAAGGRFGGTIAFFLTAILVTAFGSWRSVLWLYGAIGLALGGLSWALFRDTPAEHPWANDAERALAWTPAERADAAARTGFPWLSLLTHRGLWALNLASFASNVGWAFLVTWFPKYLSDVHHLKLVNANVYTTILLGFGMFGMFAGGWLTDAASRRWGLRWGRRVPFLICASLAAMAYLTCLRLDTPIAVTVACCLVAFLNDCMVPAVWAFGQDVGKRFTAAAFAWSNAWGNFGAAFLARVMPWVLHHFDWRDGHNQPNWHAAFLFCAGAFAVMALASLGLDSTRPLGASEPLTVGFPVIYHRPTEEP